MAPFRRGSNLPPRVDVERRPDGTLILRSPYRLISPPATILEPIQRWASDVPDRIWLAERRGQQPGWRELTYSEGFESIRRIGEGLIARGISGQDAPLMILSGNGIDHALMAHGAMLAGCPAAPVSKAYSLSSSDFAKLKFVFELIGPKAIYADDLDLYGKALKALNLEGVAVFHSRRGASDLPSTGIEDLLAKPSTAVADAALARIKPDDVAKYLCTSGSTGVPKAVISTHRMNGTNSAMLRSVLESPETEPPAVTLSWLPWSHTFGSNSVLNSTTVWGGTLYIDQGSPTPQGFAETLRNLHEISPTTYSNVPAAWAMLAQHLEQDQALARTFFKRIRLLHYGGAALSQDVADRIQAVAARVAGERIPFSTGYGSTESSAAIMAVYWPNPRTGLIGLPLPGCAIKLVPTGTKYEVRAKGDAITPGYFKRPDLTEQAFDSEGYYSFGDAAKFVDPADPSQGFVFDGRVVEDFKLDTGTFVNAGRLRIQTLEAGAGLIQDALVGGLNRPYVAVLAWPNLAACGALAGRALTPEQAATDPAVLAAIAEGLKRHNAANPGSSTAIRRFMFMTEPPSLDAGEITDKGSINQALSLDRRQALVEQLYADPVQPGVVAV